MKSSKFLNQVLNSVRLLLTIAIIALSCNQLIASHNMMCTGDIFEPNYDFTNATYMGDETLLQITDICITPNDIDMFRFEADGETYFVMVKGYFPTTMGEYQLSVKHVGNQLQIETHSFNNSETNTYVKLFDAYMMLLSVDDSSGQGSFSKIVYYIPHPPYLTLTPLFNNVNADAGSTSFSISSNLIWEVEIVEGEDWITISQHEGFFNGTINVTFQENQSEISRIGLIKVVTENLERTFSITQAGNVIPVCSTDIYEPNNQLSQSYTIGTADSYELIDLCLIAGDNDIFNFNVNGEIFHIRVRGFSPSSLGTYRLIYLRDGNTISFETKSNEGSEIDTYIYLYNATGSYLTHDDDSGNGLFSKISYEIPPISILTITPIDQLVGYESGITSFEITSNIGWSIFTDANWLTLNTQNGSFNGTVNVNYSSNLNADSRTATIIIEGGGITKEVTITQDGFISVNCVGDAYEPNNNHLTASFIGAGSNYSLDNLCLTQGDLDYFKFDIDGETYKVKVKSYDEPSTGKYQLTYQRIGNSLTIETHPLNNSETDTYLFLYNEHGDNVAKDNNGGVGNFSKIIYEVPAPIIFSVNTTSINVNSTLGAASINLTSNTSWTVSENEDWMTVSSMSGINNAILQINFNNNIYPFSRTGFISITNGIDTITINVIQEGIFSNICGGDAYEFNNTIENAYLVGANSNYVLNDICLTPLDLDYFKFIVDGVPYYLRVRGYSAISLGEYQLSYQRIGNTLVFETQSNNGSNIDTHIDLYNMNGYLIASNDDFGSSLFSKITYSLPFFNFLYVSPSNQTVASEAGVTSFEISSNVNWTATTNVSWIVISPAIGNNNGNVFIDYDENDSENSRTGVINISGGGQNVQVIINQSGVELDTNCTGDSYEPNNYISNSYAFGSNNNYVINDLCLTLQDEDYFSFIADGSIYHVMVKGYTPIVSGKYNLTWNRIGDMTIIETSSNDGSDIDTELFLYDENGILIASNDDNGATTFSKIIYAFPRPIGQEQGKVTTENNEALEAKIKHIEINANNPIKKDFKIENIYPNPVHDYFTVDYSLAIDSKVSFRLLDAKGTHIDLNLNENNLAGTYSQIFKIKDNLPAGNYFLELATSNGQLTMKQLVVIKN